MSELQICTPKEGYGYIYHLLDDLGAIIYVGSTNNIYARIGTHLKDKEFAKIQFWLIPEDLLYTEEASRIIEYDPKLNKVTPRNPIWISKCLFCQDKGYATAETFIIEGLIHEFGFILKRGCLLAHQWEVIDRTLKEMKNISTVVME